MKLSYITRVAVPGTAAQSVQIHNMCRAFHGRLGAGFRLIASQGHHAPPSPDPAPPYPVTRYVCKGAPSHPVNYARFAGKAALTGLFARETVVFTRDIAVAAACVAARGRAVYELHRDPMTSTGTRLTRWLAGQPRAGFVAISQALADHCLAGFAIPPGRMHVDHDGAFPEDLPPVTPATRAALRAGLDLPPGARILVHTGSLYKGGGELFGPIAQAAPGALVVHIGGSPEEVAHWQAVYAAQGIENIRILPRVPHETALAYQRAADVLIYLNTRENPIHWCTSPLKLFEYMASGVPIIGANIGSVGEVLNEDNAFCFDPDQPEAAAGATRRALADPDGAAARAARARALIETTYSWDKRAARIIAFAEGLGKERRNT